MEELILSYSRISTWKQNHFDHYQRYVNHLTPRSDSAPLIRGSMIHALLEAYGNGRSWIKEWERQREEYIADPTNVLVFGDIPHMAYQLMENWVEYWGEIESNREVIGSEIEFTLPLCKGRDENGKRVQIYLKGFIDSVFRDLDTGAVYIRDYKTYSRAQPYEFFLYNYQSSIYQWALPQLIGETAKGMEWDIITAKLPKKPVKLASGKLSEAKLASTPLTVRQGIIELGFDPDDYTSFINKHSYSEFLYRHEIRRNKTFIKNMMADIKVSAKQIARYQTEFKDFNLDTKYPSSYKSLWEAEIMGADVEDIISTKYERREH